MGGVKGLLLPSPRPIPVWLRFIYLFLFGILAFASYVYLIAWQWVGVFSASLDLKFLYMCFKTGIWVEGVSAWALGYSGSFYIAAVADWEVGEGE